ncbi:hypothetical protein BK004_04065 [bacterium CG10_46_32]|nr:MAG: hypothetical protein BK004_04065 [bacterium CG10_46_32]PIR55794.1 MAG: hypothetical protein COU73_04105 [Parcubacteria group bacterium CG10_big_fil_rev_8_21_14_0_10_46_32]
MFRLIDWFVLFGFPVGAVLVVWFLMTPENPLRRFMISPVGIILCLVAWVLWMAMIVGFICQRQQESDSFNLPYDEWESGE